MGQFFSKSADTETEEIGFLKRWSRWSKNSSKKSQSTKSNDGKTPVSTVCYYTKTPTEEVVSLKTKSESIKSQSTKTDDGEIPAAGAGVAVIQTHQKTRISNFKEDSSGEIPAEEVAELRTKAELRVPTHQKVRTSNFRVFGYLSRLWFGSNTTLDPAASPSHEGKTVNNLTFTV